MSDTEDHDMENGSPAAGDGDDFDNPAPANYDDTNRAFLQALMSRGSITFEQGQSILAAIFSATRNSPVTAQSVTRETFHDYIHAAHEILLPLDLDIRSARHQRTKERVWALVNVESDPATQLATVHSADEMAYINRLLDLMFEKFNTPRMEIMAVEENECLKISRPPRPARQGNNNNNSDDDEGDEERTQGSGDKGLRHSEIFTLLANLVAEGWLEKSRAGYYTLTPRSLMELKGWLVETYNEPREAGEEEVWQPIKFCEACKEIVTMGQRCADPDCLTRIHDICTRGYWESRPDKKCPRCQKEWTGKLFVGEKAVTSTEAYGRRKRKSGGGGGGRRREGRQEEVEEQNGEGGEDEDGEE